jgi:phenol hydroxylase P5 protein
MAVQKFTGEVLRHEYITPTVFEIDFKLSQKLEFEAGQFIMVKFKDPENPEKTLSRAYSIASAPERDALRLCVKLVEGGKGTNYLNGLKIGTRIDLSGPYGKFVYKTQKPKFPFFISTGTGIAPFLGMIESNCFLQNKPDKGICLLGIRTEDEILYEKDFHKIPNMKFVATVSQPTPQWKGFKGRVTDYLNELPESFDWLAADYYLCGNGAMIKEVKEFLIQKGGTKDSIHQEIYFT